MECAILILFEMENLIGTQNCYLYRNAKRASDGSQIKEARQLRCWLRHTFEPTLPRWASSGSAQERLAQDRREAVWTSRKVLEGAEMYFSELGTRARWLLDSLYLGTDGSHNTSLANLILLARWRQHLQQHTSWMAFRSCASKAFSFQMSMLCIITSFRPKFYNFVHSNFVIKNQTGRVFSK